MKIIFCIQVTYSIFQFQCQNAIISNRCFCAPHSLAYFYLLYSQWASNHRCLTDLLLSNSVYFFCLDNSCDRLCDLSRFSSPDFYHRQQRLRSPIIDDGRPQRANEYVSVRVRAHLRQVWRTRRWGRTWWCNEWQPSITSERGGRKQMGQTDEQLEQKKTYVVHNNSTVSEYQWCSILFNLLYPYIGFFHLPVWLFVAYSCRSLVYCTWIFILDATPRHAAVGISAAQRVGYVDA